MQPRMKMVWGEARRNSKNENNQTQKIQKRKKKRKTEGISLKKGEGKQH